MKTTMTELVDIMNADQVSFTEWFQDNYQMLIEKEKEQILRAYNNGSYDILMKEDYRPKEYYNETYQNK